MKITQTQFSPNRITKPSHMLLSIFMFRSLKIYLKKKQSVFLLGYLIIFLELVYLMLKRYFEIINTQLHLCTNWQTIQQVRIPIEHIFELSPPDIGYYIYNPTLINFKGELNFFARISNRSFIPKTDMKSRTLQRSKVDKTYDGICSFKVSENLDLISFDIINTPHSPPCFQDPRAIIFNDEVVLFGNYLVKEPYGSDRSSIIQTAFFDLKTMHIRVLNKVSNKNIEKNWIPFALKGKVLTLVYRSKPFTIMRYNLESDTATFTTYFDSLADLDFHGGSQFIELNNQFFARIVRYKHRFPKLGLINLSYVMVHNHNLDIVYVSKPFIFRKFGLEICNGLTVKDGRIYFAWGEDDIRMYSGSMRVDDFLQWVYNSKTLKWSRINILSKRVFKNKIWGYGD